MASLRPSHWHRGVWIIPNADRLSTLGPTALHSCANLPESSKIVRMDDRSEWGRSETWVLIEEHQLPAIEWGASGLPMIRPMYDDSGAFMGWEIVKDHKR